VAVIFQQPGVQRIENVVEAERIGHGVCFLDDHVRDIFADGVDERYAYVAVL